MSVEGFSRKICEDIRVLGLGPQNHAPTAAYGFASAVRLEKTLRLYVYICAFPFCFLSPPFLSVFLYFENIVTIASKEKY